MVSLSHPRDQGQAEAQRLDGWRRRHRVTGQLDDFPPDHVKYWLRKDLV
jgi:hypothetical protein